MSQYFSIQDRAIGEGHPVYIVAEMSANHHQDFSTAVRIVEEAQKAGADAIKLQLYTPDSLTIESDRAPFQVHGGNLWDGRSLYDLYQEACMPWEWYPRLQEIANALGMACFASPFDTKAIEYLERHGAPAIKIASFELVDLALIARAARSGKPLILSTGMATLGEIEEAVATARGASHGGSAQILLLKCNSAYPAPAGEMNLRTIPHLSQAMDLPVGLSDHTLGIVAPVTATALGACFIEKHFILSRADGGPDAAFSLEPEEFRQMVAAVHAAEQALGKVWYGVTPQEEKSRAFRRSLFVVADMLEGETFTSANLRSIRPGDGLHPRFLGEVLGRRATRAIGRGEALSWDMVGG